MTITDTATTQVGRPDDDPARFSESDDVDVLFEEFLTTRGPDRDLAYLAVEQHIRRLRALQARMLSEVRRSCSYLDDTHHTPANWVQAVTNSSIATARQITNTAALFEQLPGLATTYATGHIEVPRV